MNYKKGNEKVPKNQLRKCNIQWREILKKENEKSRGAEIMTNHNNNGNTFLTEILCTESEESWKLNFKLKS